jgi:hypothetical protein
MKGRDATNRGLQRSPDARKEGRCENRETFVCCQQMAEKKEEHMKTNHSRTMLGGALAYLLLLLAL